MLDEYNNKDVLIMMFEDEDVKILRVFVGTINFRIEEGWSKSLDT